MSDGSPVLGPKIARPTQGTARSAPAVDPGSVSNGLRGIVVVPWRLTKPSATRTAVAQNQGGAALTFQIPIDVGFMQLE
jgi:hypothetical protein